MTQPVRKKIIGSTNLLPSSELILQIASEGYYYWADVPVINIYPKK
jgi:hypothetical protein